MLRRGPEIIVYYRTLCALRAFQPMVRQQPEVELPWAALRTPPGLQRDASTQAMRGRCNKAGSGHRRNPKGGQDLARQLCCASSQMTGVDFRVYFSLRLALGPNPARADSREFHSGLLD
jgi:hypothetical protein